MCCYCELCGVILSTKQSLKCHMTTIHSEKVTSYQCSKCLTTCNRLDNISRHVTNKHSGQTSTPKTVMYEMKERSPEPTVPKRPRPMSKKTPLPMRPYCNEPLSTSDYIYQQILKPKQKPPIWRLIYLPGIPARKPIRRPEDLPPIPSDPRLDLQTLQDLEEMKRQLLTELDVSSSDSSPDFTPIQDQTDLQDHPEHWIILDQIQNGVVELPKHWFLKIKLKLI